jgi:hypothetical protein
VTTASVMPKYRTRTRDLKGEDKYSLSRNMGVMARECREPRSSGTEAENSIKYSVPGIIKAGYSFVRFRLTPPPPQSGRNEDRRGRRKDIHGDNDVVHAASIAWPRGGVEGWG